MNDVEDDLIRSGAESLREEFFKRAVGQLTASEPCDILLITHLVDDRPSLVRAVNQVGKVRAIVPISSAVDQRVVRLLTEAGNNVLDSTAAELLHDGALETLVLDLVDSSDRRLIVCEIGGYLAGLVNDIAAKRPGRLAGVIEGTEAGHRLYEVQPVLDVPVVSVARSPLKETETRMVGASCLHSVEKLLRNRGVTCVGLRATVIGYGKVGTGIAEAARRRGFSVSVWDIDPMRRILALIDGFQVPSRNTALVAADVIIGATGRASVTSEDLPALKDGVLLVSASSRTVEFGDIPEFISGRHEHVSYITREHGAPVFLAAGGTPVNFLDGAVLGHSLDLIQSEILVAIARIGSGELKSGLSMVPAPDRTLLAETWLATLTTSDGTLRFVPEFT